MTPVEKQFLEAYDAYSEGLFKHCYFRVGDRDQTKDIVQDTFTKTWKYLSQGNTITHFKAFLYRTAHNLIIDEARKKRTVSLEHMMEEENFSPAAEGTDAITERASKEAMELLKFIEEPFRQAITMRYVDGLSVTEIAETLGESPNTISIRLHRGIKKLKVVCKI